MSARDGTCNRPCTVQRGIDTAAPDGLTEPTYTVHSALGNKTLMCATVLAAIAIAIATIALSNPNKLYPPSNLDSDRGGGEINLWEST